MDTVPILETAPLHERGDAFDPECPTRMLLDRIGDKWSVLVVQALIAGPLRFGELRDRLGGVTAKALTHTLRNLERDGLLDRAVFAEVPPRVEYRLTRLGLGLRRPLAAVIDWAETNVSDVLAARDRYDADRPG